MNLSPTENEEVLFISSILRISVSADSCFPGKQCVSFVLFSVVRWRSLTFTEVTNSESPIIDPHIENDKMHTFLS